MNRTGLLLLLACAFCFASTVNAQVQTGTPPFGTFGGGSDVINLANLNAHLTIPVLYKAGRGLPFVFDLTQDSSVWYPVMSGSTGSWQPVTGWGWNQSAANIGSITNKTTISQGKLVVCNDSGFEARDTTTTYSQWTYTDGFHTSHVFPFVTDVVKDGCTGISTPDSGEGTTSDGSGYFLSVTGNQIQQLLGRDGNAISPMSGAGSMTDRNGNEITLSSNGILTDTLGQTAITIAGSGTPASPKTFTYQAPSAANAVYTEKFTSYTVQTNFGCGGISEFGPTSENLVTEIDLPDQSIVANDRYLITYEATPGHPGNVTGRIASIQLPTGGTISYSYTGGSNGITCADGTTATLTRTTPDGTWTYAHSESGTAWTTTMTDPQNNQTVYDFQGIYQTERRVYQGTSTLLEDDVTCYNGNISSCNGTAIALPITLRIVKKTLGTQVCEHVYSYNSFGLLTEQDDYDYGNGAPGALIRKKLISYASLGNNIVDSPSQITIENGSGTVVAQTNVTYDGGSVVATSGTPQHSSISGSRGNPTSISYTVAGSTTLTKSFTYFDTGNVDVATDVNSGTTTFTYGACGNSFVTGVTEAISTLTQSMAWNCTGGVETSFTDENGNTVSTTYNDSYFWRPASAKDQEQNATNYTYANPNSIETSLLFNGSNSTADVLSTLDPLGRAHVTQQKQSPGSTTYDSVETDYDSSGRLSRKTVPYNGTSGQTSSSAPATTQTYDALNRTVVTTDGGGGTVTLSYSANDVLQAIGPAPSGENTKRRQSEYNSIGELTSVCEVTGLSGSGTCGQTTSATGYWTKYTYDVLGDLLTVTQNAQSSSTQSRSFTYDGLGRMTSETNPETGKITYLYDSADSSCGSYASARDLVEKKDAAGNVTCYTYDALHRNASITYPSGPNSANTPSKYFAYDSATVNSVAMANAKAHLAEAYTCTSSCSSKITDEGFSYTARGEVSDVYESTPHSSGYFHVNETYWANGALDQISGLSGLPTVTYGPDGEGRANTVSSSSGQNPVSSTSYNVASEATGLTLGSTDSDAFQFDPNTFRMTQYQFNVNGSAVTGVLTWNDNGSLQKLNITDAFNAANTQTCNYSYDDLARIASGNCGSIWSQTFSYDAFGNITKSGNSQFQPGYNENPPTNQMLAPTTYDSNGDVLSDGLHSYAWDAETRPTTIDSVSVTYDALGRMVEQSKSGTNTEIVYDALGNKLALMSGTSTLKQAFVPLPAGATAVYNASGLQYYRHPDWLGSSRFSSTPNRTMYNDLAYAPFGEIYATSGTTTPTNISFAGNNEDTTTNLYDAYFREYGIQGRWPSPDPAGIAAANPANPQSWNRYAYVMNNPLLYIDPQGLKCVQLDDGTWADDEQGGGCPKADLTPATVYAYTEDNPQDPANDPGVNGPGFGSGGFGGPGAGSGGGQNGPQSPQSPPSKQTYQQCVSSFQNTTVGKVVKFGSVLSFASSFWNTAKAWGEAIVVKGSYFKIAELAGQSLQSGGEVTAVTTVAKPLVGLAATSGVLLATGIDIEVRLVCAGQPPTFMGPIGLP